MIDITFDFQTDTLAGKDPDYYSKTMKEYHRLLWSKSLPNGECMQLEGNRGGYYLRWNDFYFGSDSIIISFRYNKKLMDQVKDAVPDYDVFMKELFHKSYTVGGTILFPMHAMSLNQRRGMHPRIRDRFDLTLECIRRFYNGETSPLIKGLEQDRTFFELFVDFKGYVDFFFLNDCVSADYGKVNCWYGDMTFQHNAMPQTLDDYWKFLDYQSDFLEKRNQRIKLYADRNNL